MAALAQWLRRRPVARTAAGSPTPDAALNPATRVTLEDLIGLQRHAGTIDLTHTRSASSRLAGSHLSRFRGRGMDYQESRAYQAGDDIRSMDWRVTARTGTPHIKLYQEERERPVVLFLDLNPGMFFGSRGMLKSVVAARAAALIAWAAAAHGDRIGGMLFNGVHRDLPPRGGKNGVLRLISQVVEHTDPRAGVSGQAHPDGLNAALGRLRRVSRPGSLVVLLGDYYGIDEDSRKHLLRLRQHSDVVAIQIVDPLEEAPPAAARYGVTAGGRSGVLDTRSSAARDAYQGYFSRHHETVAATMRGCAIPLLRLSTGEDVAAALRKHFAAQVMRPRSNRLAA
ncbi:MAG: DUF58 domain-containing protein [Burkholderiales bacterium]|nr:DUF58 domain-containing protein [Burkholderiales bacterium]